MNEFVATPCTTDLYYLGESCRWDEVRGELCWINIEPSRSQFFRATVSGPDVNIVRELVSRPPVTAFAPLVNRDQGWIVALPHSVALMDEDGTMTSLATLGADNKKEDRTNDGSADPWGRFLTGSMALANVPEHGRLYRFDAKGGVEVLVSDLTISNGLGWSPDRHTFYHVDSGPGSIYAFDVDDQGALSNRRIFASFDVPREGTPDGLCVDDDGCIWVAIWGGAEVRCYDPAGELRARVAVDTSQPSSCALGGPDGTTLYITTAREDMTPDQLGREPHAGRLFCAEVGSRGPSVLPFRPAAPG
jgi:sugar lactone lactonase YvrE